VLVPARAGPEPYPVLPERPFDLAAQGNYLLDEKTAAALSAGEASLSEAYAWEFERAEGTLSPDGAFGRFLYPEKFAGTRQRIALTYTVTVTWLKEDLPPQDYSATDTLDVLVMYGGGRILEGGEAELYLYPPDQNGQVCDMITVYAKVYAPYVFGDLQMRGLYGQWYSMFPMLVESTPQYTLWCCGWSTADVPDMKNTAVDWRVVYYDDGDPPAEHTEGDSWTRYNTVVHCPADKVLKWDPYDEGNCDTNAVFTIDHLDYGDPDWTVTVKIYNAGGGVIRTLEQGGGFQIGENSVPWDGFLEPPPYGPGGYAPKGLYTYTVEAVHTEGSPYWPNEMCKDRDKAIAPELRVTAVNKVSFDVPDLVLVLDVDYEALQAAAVEGRIAIYDPAFNKIAVHDVGPNGDGNVPQGYSDTERFELELAAEQVGVFTAVFIGEQTAVAGLANRDELPKAARQGLGTVELWPGAYDVVGEGILFPGNIYGIAEHHDTPGTDGTRYEATVGAALAVDLREGMLCSAIVYANAHANCKVVDLADKQPGWDHCLRSDPWDGDDPLYDSPDDDMYFIEYKATLERLLFVFYDGCNSAGTYEDPFPETGIAQASLDKGADCVAGYLDEVSMLQTWTFADEFWLQTMQYGVSVAEAHTEAYDRVYDTYFGLTGGTESFAYSSGCMTLKPARYGE